MGEVKHNAGFWTPARYAVLEKMWLDGKSAQDIATALGGEISRNAVISKANRTGLAARRSPEATAIAQGAGRRKSGETRAASPKPKLAASPGPGAKGVGGWGVQPGEPVPPYKPGKVEGDGPPLNLTLLELPANGCKWPVNDGRPHFLFCGHRRLGERPYCRGHAVGGASASVNLARHSHKELVRSVRRFL